MSDFHRQVLVLVISWGLSRMKETGVEKDAKYTCVKWMLDSKKKVHRCMQVEEPTKKHRNWNLFPRNVTRSKDEESMKWHACSLIRSLSLSLKWIEEPRRTIGMTIRRKKPLNWKSLWRESTNVQRRRKSLRTNAHSISPRPPYRGGGKTGLGLRVCAIFGAQKNDD